MPKRGSAVDATLTAAPSSAKNSSGARDPEMKQSGKDQQWHFGMTCHTGTDLESNLTQTARGTSSTVNDITGGPGKRRTLDQTKPIKAPSEQLEKVKAGIRAGVAHPF